MPEHEPKRCPRCGNGFECRQGSIHRCQCVDVMLTDEVRETIAHTYDDCLCRDCLQALAAADSIGDSVADAAGAANPVATGLAKGPSPMTTSKPSPLMPSQVLRERRRQARDAARARSVRPEEVLAALNGLPGRR